MANKQYADRECPECKVMIPGHNQIYPSCGKQVGRVSKNSDAPGSYKGWMKK